MVVIFGLMGTGKTTLARALGESLGWPVVHSDVVRKSLAGLPATAKVRVGFGEGIYSEAFSRPTYAEMRRLAREYVATAGGVILDASFKQAAERRHMRELAQAVGARVVFIHCICAPAEVRERLQQRAINLQAISDGRSELITRQAEDFDPVGPEERPLLQLDTARPVAELVGEVRRFLLNEGIK